MLHVHTPQHGASSAHSVQRQQSARSNQSPAARSVGSPAATPGFAASHSFAPSPRIADSPGGTEWHGAATAALGILLDSLQPAMGAILAHTLGPDIWQDCLDPRPPWRTARDMLMALPSARDSLGMQHTIQCLVAVTSPLRRFPVDAFQLLHDMGAESIASHMCIRFEACRQQRVLPGA